MSRSDYQKGREFSKIYRNVEAIREATTIIKRDLPTNLRIKKVKQYLFQVL